MVKMFAVACLGIAVLVNAFEYVSAADYKGDKFKGQVELVTGGKLVITTKAEESVEFLLSNKTDVMRNGRPATPHDIAIGDIAIVTARRMKGTLNAIQIYAMAPD